MGYIHEGDVPMLRRYTRRGYIRRGGTYISGISSWRVYAHKGNIQMEGTYIHMAKIHKEEIYTRKRHTHGGTSHRGTHGRHTEGHKEEHHAQKASKYHARRSRDAVFSSPTSFIEIFLGRIFYFFPLANILKTSIAS